MHPRLCLIEDDAIMGESLADRFRLEGFVVDWHRSAGAARKALAEHIYAVAISDINLPDGSGEALFSELLAAPRALPPFVFITGFGTIDSAVQLVKLGAADYVTKPFDLDGLVDKVHTLSAAAAGAGATSFGSSPAMRALAESLPRLAQHATTILINGESGCGKEHVARELHRLASAGAEQPFIAVNCGGFTETLLETELFGHEKGAFTGAVRARRGVFEQAHGGTLFLDEIGDMPLSMQVKLLRAVQEHQIVRVGGEKPIEVDFRLILATHRDLKKLVEQGAFREDLYYRIHVIHLRIPPLRERRDDILWLARQFVQAFVRSHPGEQRTLHPLTEQALLDYPWPGNVRELKHTVERACILSRQALVMPEACFDDSVNPQKSDAAISGNLGEYLRACERRYIVQALELQAWHLGRTADSLGISRKNLWEKMRKLDIQAPDGATQ
ncbi:MAG: sigma-54-dependent Fis family transcriptional regulator [Betaproteobacteria bacterium]|nr:sigma-54-dependent Fis family transcriptional regulator [Betaproteobacteria bacterium]